MDNISGDEKKERINYVITEGFYVGSFVNLPIIIQAGSLDELKKAAHEMGEYYLKDLTETFMQEEPFEYVEVDSFQRTLQQQLAQKDKEIQDMIPKDFYYSVRKDLLKQIEEKDKEIERLFKKVNDLAYERINYKQEIERLKNADDKIGEIKPVTERDNLDLLELVCQLHSRSLNYPSKEMHELYWEAKIEMQKRLQSPSVPLEADDKIGKVEEKVSLEEYQKLYRNYYDIGLKYDALLKSNGQDDKIGKAIDWCDERIKGYVYEPAARFYKAPYENMKQYLQSLKSESDYYISNSYQDRLIQKQKDEIRELTFKLAEALENEKLKVI